MKELGRVRRGRGGRECVYVYMIHSNDIDTQIYMCILRRTDVYMHSWTHRYLCIYSPHYQSYHQEFSSGKYTTICVGECVCMCV